MARFRIVNNNVREIVSNQMLQQQRNHWLELHRYRLAFWCPEQAKKDYADWKKRIPNYGCGCTSKWAEIEKKNPPDFSSAEAYFYWGVDRHNDVNRELRRPEMDHDEAWEMHRTVHAWAAMDSSGL
jgi:hypothetical protein